jgi:hypothetical protein
MWAKLCTKKCFERPDDPDIFFEQMCGSPGGSVGSG